MRQILSFLGSILIAIFLVPTIRRNPPPFWYWTWYILLVIFCVGVTAFALWLLVLTQLRATKGTIVLVGLLLVVLMPVFLIRATLRFRDYRRRARQ